MLFCTNCPERCCECKNLIDSPTACPGRSEEMKDILKEYQNEKIALFGKVSSEVSMSRDGMKPRILEIIDVAKGCGYKKIGLAFCYGLFEEARVIARVFQYHGFIVESITCKVGGIDKSLQGIENGGNAMCNPIAQAFFLNKQKTELNVVVGLCVGHDSLFFRYSNAPVTVLAVKDKVMAHNPLGVIYTADGYYKDLLFPKKRLEEVVTSFSENHPIHFFYEICQIPRKSHDEKAIGHYLTEFAMMRKLEWEQDEVGNVRIRKGGSPGRETDKRLILQAHMDMVFVSDDTALHAYGRPINVFVDSGGDIITAEGTSLGADDGLGVAVILAILASDSISCPPIDAIFTINEEDGLEGASRLKREWIDTERLINLDGEIEDKIITGCAGAFRGTIKLPIVREEVHTLCYSRLSISGLAGGHSGLDIDKNHMNAIVLLCNILSSLTSHEEVHLCSLDGGDHMNTIPSDAAAVIAYPPEEKMKITTLLKKLENNIRKNLVHEDKNFKLNFEELTDDKAGSPINNIVQEKLFELISSIPNGVLKKDQNVSGLVDTSNNIGIVKIEKEQFIIVFNARSNSSEELDSLDSAINSIAQRVTAQYSKDSEYPPWEHQRKSYLRELYKKISTEVRGKKIQEEIIHGGLECGIFSEMKKSIDMISVGPDIKSAHTTSEQFELSSLERFWKIITKLLEEIN